MFTQRFQRWLIVALLLGALIVGCQEAVDEGPAPTASTASPPEQVVEAFYRWYLDALRGSTGEGMRNPLAAGEHRASPFLSARFVRALDQQLAADESAGRIADPIVLAQDIPQEISFELWEEAASEARVIVHEKWTGSPPHDLTVTLIADGETWKIDHIAEGSPATPQGVVKLFFHSYLVAARREGGSPLEDGAYRESRYLSPAYAAKIHEMLAGMGDATYDPIFLSQDIPLGIAINHVSTQDEHATVQVDRIWGPGSGPSPLVVTLQAIDSRWQITDITDLEEESDTEAAALAELSPAQVVEAFYADWLAEFGDPASGGESPLTGGAYRRSPYLTATLKQRIDEIVAGFEQGGYDPLLCAQDVPQAVFTGLTYVNGAGDLARVLVSSNFPGHALTARLIPTDEGWRIDDVVCAASPAGAAEGFLTWYLAYFHGPDGEFRNPLVSGAYKDAPFVSEAYVAKIDAELTQMRETYGGITGDPILFAQDIPQAFRVVLDTGSDTAVRAQLLFGENWHERIITTEATDGRWLITDIVAVE